MSGTSPQAFRAADGPLGADVPRNERGVIAENYHDLQGLGVLKKGRQAYRLPKASEESTIRAIFQSVEIALCNLADITARVTGDLAHDDLDAATVKMLWARGFHRLLTRLSMIPGQLGASSYNNGGILRIEDSPAFREYIELWAKFDRAVVSAVDTGNLPLEQTIAHESLSSARFQFVHAVRICNHESTIWERNLAEVSVPCAVSSFEQFVAASIMREAVYDRVLTGDTYFTQFRGLHQVPELLGEEANDRVEQAIRDMRDGRLEDAIEHLTVVDALSEGILAAMPAMVDNLATSDYHQIRENLGLTSGSHSVCLRYHMFTQLYEQLWDGLRNQMLAEGLPAGAEGDVCAAIRACEGRRRSNGRAWMLNVIGKQCLKLRAFIFGWRDEHLNLPRNNLGGEFTKSLTGSPDAIAAVKHMRDGARMRDPMLPLAQVNRIPAGNSEPGKLTRYIESKESLDSLILSTTGRITQSRFQDVQERLGFFANRCPFTPPVRRSA